MKMQYLKLYSDANEAIESSDPADLEELKAILRPSPVIAKVCKCLAYIFSLHQNMDASLNKDPFVFFQLFKDQLAQSPDKLNHMLLNFDKSDLKQNQIDKVTMILDGEDLSGQKVAQASPALVPLHLWLKAILQSFVVSQIDEQLAQMNDQLMRLKQPLVKQLNVLDILYEANYSKLLTAGLKKIVMKEIGQPGESFDVISSNELSSASAGLGL